MFLNSFFMIKYYIDRSWIDSMFEQNLKYLEKNNLFLYQEVVKYQKQENIMQNQFIIRSGKKKAMIILKKML